MGICRGWEDTDENQLEAYVVLETGSQSLLKKKKGIFHPLRSVRSRHLLFPRAWVAHSPATAGHHGRLLTATLKDPASVSHPRELTACQPAGPIMSSRTTAPLKGCLSELPDRLVPQA